MPFTYVNRMEQVYFVRATQGKDGKGRYYITTKNAGPLLEAVPDGFEVYELPQTAQVVLRRKLRTEILELEREALDQAIRRDAGIEGFRIDLEPKAMVIYLAEIDSGFDDRDSFLGAARRMMYKRRNFTKIMRFELSPAKSRAFTVSRWCFLGSIDNWLPLDGSAPLATLIKKYVKHLGKESFFELDGADL